MDYKKIYEAGKGFTFKNEPREKGLAAVGAGTPGIKIKHKGNLCGNISFGNSWSERDEYSGKATIRLMYKKTEEDIADPKSNKNCDWKWVTLKKRFDTADEAKKFLQDNADYLLPKLTFLEEYQ
jgi:hypothetical protein